LWSIHRQRQVPILSIFECTDIFPQAHVKDPAGGPGNDEKEPTQDSSKPLVSAKPDLLKNRSQLAWLQTLTADNDVVQSIIKDPYHQQPQPLETTIEWVSTVSQLITDYPRGIEGVAKGKKVTLGNWATLYGRTTEWVKSCVEAYPLFLAKEDTDAFKAYREICSASEVPRRRETKVGMSALITQLKLC
jgi:hypothetical protein